MQKLKQRNTYTPTNTSLVRSNCDSVLNRDESLSVQNSKTCFNNSEENHRQHRVGSDLRVLNIVYVINKKGKPLMPTCQSKARRLLKQHKAVVVKRFPFTIQLTVATGENKQNITLGIDTGYINIGFSAISDKKELISGDVKLRSDIGKLLSEKRVNRSNRRSRLWYREPRFLNRKKEKGWLAPSIRHKLDSHVKLVEQIKKLLPVSKVIVEVANFDIQKIKNPEIEGTEYQKGEQLGFWNVREYVLHRDNHKCQKCKGKSKDKVLQVHHIRGKKEGATDSPEEIMTVCKTCHSKHHKGIGLIPVKDIKDFKPETFMSTVRWKLVDILECGYTYGYITKHNRIKLGLEKSHFNDAFVIAGGSGQDRTALYVVEQKRRNNRGIQINRKGFKPSVRRQRYSIQPKDLVLYQGGWVETKGCHCKGTRIMVSGKSVSVKKIGKVFHRSGMVWKKAA